MITAKEIEDWFEIQKGRSGDDEYIKTLLLPLMETIAPNFERLINSSFLVGAINGNSNLQVIQALMITGICIGIQIQEDYMKTPKDAKVN